MGRDVGDQGGTWKNTSAFNICSLNFGSVTKVELGTWGEKLSRALRSCSEMRRDDTRSVLERCVLHEGTGRTCVDSVFSGVPYKKPLW